MQVADSYDDGSYNDGSYDGGSPDFERAPVEDNSTGGTDWLGGFQKLVGVGTSVYKNFNGGNDTTPVRQTPSIIQAPAAQPNNGWVKWVVIAAAVLLGGGLVIALVKGK